MDFINRFAEQFFKANRRLKRWQRVVSLLAAFVVFVTTYAMVLPAITLDKETASAQSGLEIAASENEPESDGTVYEAEPEEEPAEELTEEPQAEEQQEEEHEEPQDSQETDSVAEDSGSESGSLEAEVSSEDDNDDQAVKDADIQTADEQTGSKESIDAKESGSYAGSDEQDEAAPIDEILPEAETPEEIKLITEKTQLTYEYIDEYYEDGIEDENDDGIDDGYFVYAEFGTDAKLPEGVELSVKEITKESDPDLYAMYCEKTLSEVQDRYDENTGITFAKFYDISFVYQGTAVEPGGDVKIRIEYKREIEVRKDEKVDAIHFDKEDENPEVIESEINPEDKEKDKKSGEAVAEPMKAVEFTSDRFSVYGVVGSSSITATFLSADGNTYEVTITCDTDANIPAGSDLVVNEVEATDDKYEEYLANAAEAMDVSADKITYAKLLDISIVKDGEDIIPETPVDVQIRLLDRESFDENESLNVIHYESENENPVLVDGSEQDGVVSFEAEGFSVYGVFYTVDFHYEVNGKMYQFSLPGGGFVSFTDLVEVLGIIGDTNSEENGDENGSAIAENAEENGINEGAEENGINADTNTVLTLGDVEVSEATKKFVADVASVEFSNPELVDVSKVEEDTTAGQIKESRGLECEYSAELTEDQIVDINAQTVEAGDWALISLQPFKSDESLTVTMKNGDQFVVNVTDAQLKKTVISASGETIEVVVTYDDSAEIPVGATLEITEFAEDSDEYQAAREAVVEKKQSEDPAFDDEEFGVTAFDVSIVDEDGNQVEPKATVDVSMKMKSLPEEAAEENVQYSFEIHHLDESSGEVAVENVASAIDGSIQIEEETAQAEFQLDSFSTFTVSWNRRGTDNNTTDLRWRYRQNYWEQYTARAFLTANYVDESGNAISRPNGIGYTIDNDNFYDGAEYTVDIGNVLGISVDNYTYKRAYITDSDGKKLTVTSVKAERHGNTSTVSYYNEAEVVKSASYTGTDRHDFGDDGLDVTIEYEKNNNFTTVHYGYMDGDRFVEFDQQPGPTDTSTSLGWAHLIHDFYGTDNDGPFQYRYAGTYYSADGPTDTPVADGTQIHPLLRYNGNRWKYFDQMNYAEMDMNSANAAITNDGNWKNVNNGSDIYLVYEKPVVTPGGSPTLKVDGDLPDAPNILKESVENEDGTNTLSLSVTGSTEPMVAEKVADVIVILDLSTSMRRDITNRNTEYTNDYQVQRNSRFYQAKQALQKLADELYDRNDESGSPQYSLGLITFSNKAVVKRMPTASRQEFQTTINSITAHDTAEGTNWEHSLMLANSLTLPDDRATYIVFITDGAPTVRQTRLNLTDVQLDGYNVGTNLQEHGDIFHGGLNNGGFYSGGYYRPDRLHFRDYLGNASFGGITDNDDMNERNRIAAVDEALSIVSHDKGLFAIGVSTDASSLEQFITGSDKCGLSDDHYTVVSNEDAFLKAIDKVVDDLNGITGQADVRMFDGITDLTQTISKVNQEENRLIGADGNFTYWKSNPPQATWDEVKATWTDEQKEGFNTGAAYAGQTGTPDGYADWSKEKKATFELGKQSVATSGQTAKNPADLWGSVWRTWDKSLKDAYNAGVEYIGSDDTPDGYSDWSNEKKAAYAIGKKVTFSEWTTREADGCAAAVYNTTSGAVEWNMGETFMLEDGITYKVSFICWPSQEAYDIIAKLENGTIAFGDTNLYPQAVWAQFEGNATNGYRLKTNTDDAYTKYKSATSVSGNVTVGNEQPQLDFQHVPPMPLDKDKLNVAKTWEASRIDSVTPESVVLQVVGDDELYKQFEIEPTEMVDGSATNNYGKSEDIYISCGHIKVDRTTGKVVVYESGHDFTLREVEENSRHWDLDASVCRPMKINTVETMLVLVKDENVPAGMTSDIDYYKSGNDEYYRLDGKVYKDTNAWADITGMNTRRSFLDLAKEVLVDNEVWTEEVDEKFTYKIKINIDPTTLSWDPDIENYIIISIRGNGYTPAAAIADQTYPTTAVLPSQSGMDSSLIHDHYDELYLVAKSGEEFYLSIKNGWSVRFLNLPAGTTYSIEEVLPEDSNYDFNQAKLEIRKDRSSTNPVSTNTFTTKKVEGSIAETSTLYKLIYQNDAKTKEVQILKTGQDANTPLGGAKFDLYTESAYISDPQGTPFKTDLVSSNEAATKGKINLGELPIGKYYLVETKAPDGYNMRTEPVIIIVSKTSVTYDDGTNLSQSGLGISQIEDAYQLKVTNDEGVALPHTGGPGTKLFTILGSILILGAGVLLWRRRRLI